MNNLGEAYWHFHEEVWTLSEGDKQYFKVKDLKPEVGETIIRPRYEIYFIDLLIEKPLVIVNSLDLARTICSLLFKIMKEHFGKLIVS